MRPADLLTGEVTLSAKFGDVYFPLAVVQMPPMRLPIGVQRQLLTLDFIGQISQCSAALPSANRSVTGQPESPVHEENALVAGKPGRALTEMVKVTCFFASGQENVCGTSDIFESPSAPGASGGDGTTGGDHAAGR